MQEKASKELPYTFKGTSSALTDIKFVTVKLGAK